MPQPLTFTVGDIAKRIMEPDEDFVGVRERLRVWVRSGLLEADERNPDGRHQFSERTIVEAAILDRLAKHYASGTKIGTSGPLVRKALDFGFKQMSKTKVAEGHTLYLFIAWEGAKSYVNVQVVDPTGKTPDRRLIIPPTVDDCVFINLNRLFDRVHVPLNLYVRRD